ncbi:MAG: hypothetical protein IJB97_00550 [Clostridia bacterium]|nr:hypothetical protein [Clostridia bacterium]
MRSFKNYNGYQSDETQTATGVGAPQGGGRNGFEQASGISEVNGIGGNEKPPELSAAEDLTKRLAEAFNGQSSGVMLKKILEEAEEKKRAGELSNAEIDQFYAQFSPMLTLPQRTVLKSVIDRLKQI